MDGVSAGTPAKINLFLYVLGKRPDGYHDILTLMQKVSLYDTVGLSVADGEGIDIRVTGGAGDVPSDGSNTACAAARLFLTHKNIQGKRVRIAIEKRIPSRAGMGGASSDAACVLKLLNGLLPAYRADELSALSGRIGSDVPFFMMDGSGVASGRGDVVTRAEIVDRLHYVVIKPGFGISTSRAYARLEQSTKPLTKQVLPSMCDLTRYTKGDIERCLHNDLETVAEEHTPEITMMKERLLSTGAKAAAMTGSGSCVFGIFYDEKQAQEAFDKLSRAYATVFKVTGI